MFIKTIPYLYQYNYFVKTLNTCFIAWPWGVLYLADHGYRREVGMYHNLSDMIYGKHGIHTYTYSISDEILEY